MPIKLAVTNEQKSEAATIRTQKRATENGRKLLKIDVYKSKAFEKIAIFRMLFWVFNFFLQLLCKNLRRTSALTREFALFALRSQLSERRAIMSATRTSMFCVMIAPKQQASSPLAHQSFAETRRRASLDEPTMRGEATTAAAAALLRLLRQQAARSPLAAGAAVVAAACHRASNTTKMQQSPSGRRRSPSAATISVASQNDFCCGGAPFERGWCETRARARARAF